MYFTHNFYQNYLVLIVHCKNYKNLVRSVSSNLLKLLLILVYIAYYFLNYRQLISLLSINYLIILTTYRIYVALQYFEIKEYSLTFTVFV